MSVKDVVGLLRQIPLFASVDAAQLQVLAFSSERVHVKTGEMLIKKGERSAAGFLILDGQANALQPDGAEGKVIAAAKAGAFLGQASMVARLPHAVSVEAVTPVVALKISHDLFVRVCSEFPETAQNVLTTLSRNLDLSISDLQEIQRLFSDARPLPGKHGG